MEIFIPLLLLLIGYAVLTGKGSRRRSPSLRSVAILVLGDIGRSPRMMYHAESFANNGFRTFLVGYDGTWPAMKTWSPGSDVGFKRIQTKSKSTVNSSCRRFTFTATAESIFQLAVFSPRTSQDNTPGYSNPLHVVIPDFRSARVSRCTGSQVWMTTSCIHLQLC